jgi:hypothetical protein
MFVPPMNTKPPLQRKLGGGLVVSEGVSHRVADKPAFFWRIMTSVVQRIWQTTQPRGGYINPKAMEATQLGDGSVQLLDYKAENVHPMVVGMTVDYLSRLANGAEPEDAFGISLRGAMLLDWAQIVSTLDTTRLDPVVDLDYLRHEADLEGMEHLADAALRLDALTPGVAPDDDAIRAAVHLVGYDIAFRQGPSMYRDQHAVPDAITISHIRTMLERAASFFALYGPVTADGFHPVDRLSATHLVNSGDGDFLTADTLWDFKVSVNPPTKDHTLQLLMYLLMGQRSAQAHFNDLTHLGVYNPRLNTVYRIALADVPSDVVGAVACDVIGYL